MVREVASKAPMLRHGTTTATVLAAAIVREGAKSVPRHEPDGSEARYRSAVDAVVADLVKTPRRSPRTRNRQVAPSPPMATPKSANSSPTMKKVGNEGVITVEKPSRLRPNSRSSKACSSTVVTSRPTSSPTPTRCAVEFEDATSSLTKKAISVE